MKGRSGYASRYSSSSMGTSETIQIMNIVEQLFSFQCLQFQTPSTSEALCGKWPGSIGIPSRRSKVSISFEDTQKLVSFLRNYAADHALVLPGRVPGVWKDDVVLLPSSRPLCTESTRCVVLHCALVFTLLTSVYNTLQLAKLWGAHFFIRFGSSCSPTS